jgi:hypothetical protein
LPGQECGDASDVQLPARSKALLEKTAERFGPASLGDERLLSGQLAVTMKMLGTRSSTRSGKLYGRRGGQAPPGLPNARNPKGASRRSPRAIGHAIHLCMYCMFATP